MLGGVGPCLGVLAHAALPVLLCPGSALVPQLGSRCSPVMGSALPAARPGSQRAPGTGSCPMRLRCGVSESSRNPAPG